MQLHCSLFLSYIFLASIAYPAGRALASPLLSTLTPTGNDTDAYANALIHINTPRIRHRSMGTINGLPNGWTGIFKTLTSIQPPLHSVEFTYLFTNAARLAAANAFRPQNRQRFLYGALTLDIIALGANTWVTPDFVQGASLWLRELVRAGWDDFFEAVVMDQRSGETYYLKMGNTFDMMLGAKGSR